MFRRLSALFSSFFTVNKVETIKPIIILKKEIVPEKVIEASEIEISKPFKVQTETSNILHREFLGINTTNQAEEPLKIIEEPIDYLKFHGEIKAVIVESKRSIQLDNITYDYVAIDFETANSEKTSACSVAIVAVKNGEVVEEKQWYIQPDPLIISPINQRIHGIGFEQLKNAPQFWEVWHELRPFIEEQNLVAHNMAFDKSVLIAGLEWNAITIPKFKEFCTYQMAKSTWKLDDYKLPTVADHINFNSLKHHDALSDAQACAKIFSEIQNLGITTNTKNIPVPKLGKINNSHGRRYKGVYENLSGITKTENSNIMPDHPLYGKRIVVTGEIIGYSRADVKQMILDVGGLFMTSVSKKTNYIVDGVQDSYFGDNYISGKMKEAIELKTTIITEKEFMNLLYHKF